MPDGCPTCHGVGREPDGLLCLKCDGTGIRWVAVLLRAYRLGFDEGIDAMRNAMPMTNGGLPDHRLLIDRLKDGDHE